MSFGGRKSESAFRSNNAALVGVSGPPIFAVASFQKVEGPDRSQSPRNVASHGTKSVKRRIDVRELGVEVGAEAVHSGDNREGDAGGDQTVFNGSGS